MCFVAPWWSACTCSLKSNDLTLKSSLVKDTHVQSTFNVMGAYIARPKCRLETLFARMYLAASWWYAYTCSLKSNDLTLKTRLVGDTHAQSIFFLCEPILRGTGVD